jgi:hypothetical protein
MGQRLYNANDGVTGRDGGPYLDIVEAEEAEKRRAKAEGREPDLDHPPATAGIQLNSAAQMLYTEHVNSTPSRSNTAVADADRRFDALHDDEDVPLEAYAEIPDEALTNKSADELPDVEDEGHATNPTDDAHEKGEDGDVEGNSPGTAESAQSEAGKNEVAEENQPDAVIFNK